MKIAFIEPAILNVEPMGVAYLAQCLINAGHVVRYFEIPRKNSISNLKEFNPDVLAYSIATGKHRLVIGERGINTALRKVFPKAISIFGGPHCTFFPEFIQSDSLIDGVCIGEGEEAIVELLGKAEGEGDYSKTENWWIRINGEIHKNPARRRIEDLDKLPFPNREVIYVNSDLRDTPIKRILASRGCPYACSYCFNKKYNEIYNGKGKIYRQRSTRSIVEEALEIKRKYPFTFLKFVDDNFILRNDLEEFAEIYSREVGIPFLCNCRPNLIVEEKVRLLKKAGCVAVTLAIESGNEFIRNRILNRHVQTEVLNNAISILKREGIRVWTQNIIANPGETFEMAMETFEINKRHKVDLAECFLLTPYPGTDIHRYCVENGYFDGDIDILSKSYWLDSFLKFNSEREKRRFVNFHKFFGFGVRHPWAMPIIKILIELPPNKLYIAFNRFYDAWRISRVIRARFTAKNFLTTTRSNFQFIASYFLKKEEDYIVGGV